MALFPSEMESGRLRYERLHPDDFDPFELYEHVRVGAPDIDELTAHLTWTPHETPKETFDWVEACGRKFERGEDATYLLRPTDGDREGELAGIAGMGVDWGRRSGTLGTWLRKPFWGRGYSGERAARFLSLAFDRLDLEIVAVTHDPANDNSRRAIEKYVARFGGRREGHIRNHAVVDGEPRDAVRYSVSKAEWAQNRE
ncbi:GNAT family N-acetyltransferase [Haloferacaceae archaeon DSL9]